MDELARFPAQIWKVQTLSAGGFRVTLDGYSENIEQAAYLMPFADTPGATVEVVIYRVSNDEQDKDRFQR